MPKARRDRKSGTQPPSPYLVAPQTPAERVREQKLREDPMAIVLGPLYVDCRRCGSRIKLSAKSSYDTFHWRTHRARCLKKPIGAQKPHKSKPTQPPLSPTKTSSSVSPNTSMPPSNPQKSRNTKTLVEELQLRQEAIESLKLLSRSG
ncbi:hypothetical protein AMATHDRAFT_39892 [Amanita thiersii Skay4041]|uniref:Uncharacterized protein n=1 Tax=Amanita thiersii Skay4041 TaxID=703135 RepID=A0A2A9NR33_9AGAR|nr:hypothetical protein AMATHDRAFT_39892 [Amanita thiersii Skay4041]